MDSITVPGPRRADAASRVHVDQRWSAIVRAVVIGASSGLGRCIGTGLARGGAQVALMARRAERLDGAVAEAGDNAFAIACDVTDSASTEKAIAQAAEVMGGIDGIVYAPAIGPLIKLADTDPDTWRSVFDTNVIGAATVTAAALPHLQASSGTAIFLSSISSTGPVWPGLATYAVSKAALNKLVDAWRAEHPELGFTCLTVGECAGGAGDSMTQFADGWDRDLAMELVPGWVEKGYMTGAMMDVTKLVETVDHILRSDSSVTMPNVTVTPRLVAVDHHPSHDEVAADLEAKAAQAD